MPWDRKKEVQQCRLVTGRLGNDSEEKNMLENKLNMRQKCTPAMRKANSILCCIKRHTVRELGKMVIPLFLTLLWRYLLSCPQFWHPSTRGVTGRQARPGSVTWLRAWMGKSWGKRVFSAWKRLRVKTNCNLLKCSYRKGKTRVFSQTQWSQFPVRGKKKENQTDFQYFSVHQNGKHQNRCPEIQHKIHPQRFSKFHWSVSE